MTHRLYIVVGRLTLLSKWCG